MSEVILKIESLCKYYRLGEIGTGTLSHDLNRWWAKIRGKEDPFLRVGQVNDRSKKQASMYVKVLEEVSFEVCRGEVLGIIGGNGAGKSTLLKLISQITSPSSGSIKAKGRIASLLEVGTGMHEEMTARENIFLNGSILGMTKVEIISKFDEIIEFAGCSLYVDTPVKRFSSGMRVRLGFAVAAFLEPDILIVDEVLAVGDAEFQKKAIGKMKEVSSKDGRTVLFVSHNMGAINNLCTRGLVLDKGKKVFLGSASSAVNYYLNKSSLGSSKSRYINHTPLELTDFLDISVMNFKGENCYSFNFDQNIFLKFKIKVASAHDRAELVIRVIDKNDRAVFSAIKAVKSFGDYRNGQIKFNAILPKSFLVPNTYSVYVAMHIPNMEIIRVLENEIGFEIEETGTEFYAYHGNDYGCVFADVKWISL